MFFLGLMVSILLGIGLQVIRTNGKISRKKILISITLIILFYSFGYFFFKYYHHTGAIIYD